jgi:pimeloyl-ACP methyl ester carboxylesterase
LIAAATAMAALTSTSVGFAQQPDRGRATATEPVVLGGAAGMVHGTLVIPSGTDVERKVPIVLIIAGSGPTDRDGNSAALPGKNNSYQMLADALAAEGVASLRYDKRGIGESRTPDLREEDIRFDTYVDDAAGWIRQLRDSGRFSHIVVVGHSEGSLVGMLASARANADAFVSIAGVARRASDVLRDQLRPQLAAMVPLWDATNTILSSLERGSTVDPLPAAVQAVPPMASLFRASVQPYLISWFKYVPAGELARLAVPVLVIQGTRDLQVSEAEARALAAVRPGAALMLVDGMNHVMKLSPPDPQQNLATYSNPQLPIVPDVPHAIAALAHRIAGR